MMPAPDPSRLQALRILLGGFVCCGLPLLVGGAVWFLVFAGGWYLIGRFFGAGFRRSADRLPPLPVPPPPSFPVVPLDPQQDQIISSLEDLTGPK